ncbi:hypothetical protein NN561_019105 [Cricetulus griseus]
MELSCYWLLKHSPFFLLSTFHFLLSTFHFLLSTFHFLLSTFHFLLSTFHFLLSTFHFLLSTFHFLMNTFHFLLSTFHFLLSTFHFLLSTFHFLLSTFHFLLSTFHFLLSTFHFLLSTFHFLMNTFHFLLSTFHFLLSTFHFLLSTFHFLLSTFHFLLSTFHFLLSTFHFLLSTFHFLMNTFHFLLSTFHFLLSTFHFLLSTFHFLLSIFHFLMNTFHFLLSTFHFLLSTFHFLLSTFYFLLSTFHFLLSTFHFLLSTFHFLMNTFALSVFPSHVSLGCLRVCPSFWFASHVVREVQCDADPLLARSKGTRCVPFGPSDEPEAVMTSVLGEGVSLPISLVLHLSTSPFPGRLDFQAKIEAPPGAGSGIMLACPCYLVESTQAIPWSAQGSMGKKSARRTAITNMSIIMPTKPLGMTAVTIAITVTTANTAITITKTMARTIAISLTTINRHDSNRGNNWIFVCSLSLSLFMLSTPCTRKLSASGRMLALACQALWDPPAQTQWTVCASGHLILLGPTPGAMDKPSLVASSWLSSHQLLNDPLHSGMPLLGWWHPTLLLPEASIALLKHRASALPSAVPSASYFPEAQGRHRQRVGTLHLHHAAIRLTVR